jgi:formylmethanofuran dehydrogenase subunit E
MENMQTITSTICADCGEPVNKDEALEIREGVYICDDCATNYCSCDDCGAIVKAEEGYFISTDEGGRVVCQECLIAGYRHCADCGEWFPADESYLTHSGDIICRECLNDYFWCHGCGELHPYHSSIEINGELYCEDCAEEHEPLRGIRSYHSNPKINFYNSPEGKDETKYYGNIRYFGIELEIDNGGEDDDNADALTDILRPDVWRAEHDGSISNGFELISMPTTLPWMEEFLFPILPEFCKEATELGYRGHYADSSCGLHVHVSRNTFSDDAIGNIILLMDKFWPFFLKFSRRTESAMNDWAARYDLDIEGTGETKQDRVKDIVKNRYGRYRALNLTNRNTIEFRLFRSSLNPNTIEATLRFVAWLCDYAQSLTEEEIEALEFLPVWGVHPSLDKYLTERKFTPPDKTTETVLSRPVRDIAVELNQETGENVTLHYVGEFRIPACLDLEDYEEWLKGIIDTFIASCNMRGKVLKYWERRFITNGERVEIAIQFQHSA